MNPIEKELSEMTLEELWVLFPIVLTPHEKCWRSWFLEEQELLSGRLPKDEIWRISHIGSTAIQGIWAKPIVDILVEVTEKVDYQSLALLIEGCGYLRMSTGEKRISLNKGYTNTGFSQKVFHLHLRRAGDHDELYFRDYLNEHREIAKEYEALKQALWKQFEHNRDAYTEQKTEFVQRYTEEAKRYFQNRYE